MTFRDLDVALRALAAHQHGVVGRAQAREAGLDHRAVRRRVAGPDWELVGHRVLRLVGQPVTLEQRCMVAVLDAGHGAVVCRLAAACLPGIPGFDPPMEVETTRRREKPKRPTPSGMAHEPLLLPASHCTVVRGIPVTTLARTIFDLAGFLHPARVERALDNAVARKLTTLREVHAVAGELYARGRPGTRTMRALLDARPVGTRVRESGLEARLLALLADAGLPEPEVQVDLGGPDGWIGRVDAFFRPERLVVEVDSDRHHTSALDRAADARRDAALRAAGFEVVRVAEWVIDHVPAEAVRRVEEALRRRRAA